MSNPVRLADLFRFYKHGLPHQMAAITELQEAMLKADPRLLDRDQPWFKTWSQAGKQPGAIYLTPAEKIIKEFEGCKLTAYKCPAGVWTIGWGATSVNGAAVREGDKISQALADELLRAEIHRTAQRLHQLIPSSVNWGAKEQAALISFAYNVGLGAVEDSTLRKRINAGEAAPLVVREELPRWRYGAGEAVLPGLERRRAAEVALFTGTPPAIPQQQAPRFTPSSPFSTKITPHVTYGELCLNEERRRFTSQAQCDIAVELCTFLEKARAQFGNKPLIITSGHRPQKVNQAVGGASNSEHLFKPGCGAVDWYIQGVAVQTVQNWCVKNWPYSTGLGAPKGFIHTGIRAGRPRLVWDY
jgi:lysozyme